MTAIRQYTLSHSRLVALLLALALAMKALIPVGYMIGAETKLLTVSICSDGSGHALTKVIPITGEHGPADAGKQTAPCHFGALTMGALGGADAPLLAVALAFIILLGFAAQTVPLIQRSFFLTPPLRGPPIFS